MLSRIPLAGGENLSGFQAFDAAIAAGKSVGPLAGVPFAVKNLFDVEGLATRAGSKINRDLKPSPRDATNQSPR